MFQIQSQLSTLCAISSAYAFYNAYLTDDIDGVLLDSEKIALEAAHFKESGSVSTIFLKKSDFSRADSEVSLVLNIWHFQFYFSRDQA